MSYKIYPVTQTELKFEGYEVKINGEKVDTDTARVSKVALNRRWPGHQRTLDQTELCSFVSLETDESLQFEITPKEKFEKVDIRPKSLGIEPKITPDGKVVFTLPKAAYFTVEPYGRHNALHIFADSPKVYDIDVNDENVIYFGKGEHHAECIDLKSDQTLFIDEGAVLYTRVTATDADNIRILGRGILDNSLNKEEILFEASEEDNEIQVDNAVRTHAVHIEYCTNVVIEGITIRDSLAYNIKPVACNNVDIRNVKLIGNWRYNSDGIDMHNCVNLRITHCFLRTFDDTICVKGFDCFYAEDTEEAVRKMMYRNGKSYEVCQNVHITDCVIWNDWGKCLEIGAETRAKEISDIVFENCDVIHVTGSVLDCANVDYATVHHVKYANINIEYDDMIPEMQYQYKDSQVYEVTNPDYSPYFIAVQVLYHMEYSAGNAKRGKNHHIEFDNIHIYGRQMPRLIFEGFDEQHTTSDIKVTNVYVNSKPLSTLPYEVVTNDYCSNIEIE